jgi:anti-sigma factor RsiW
MAHGDVAQLTAYLDGELAAAASGALERHLEGCLECRRIVEQLAAQRERVRAVLASLDVDGAVAAARAAAHLRQHRAAAAPRRPAAAPAIPRSRFQRVLAHRRQLLQAAVFVLFIAGGVSALVPGSPLRRMLVGGESPQEVVPALAPPSTMQAERAPEMRVRAAGAAGRLRVALQLPSGAELMVSLVEGDSAAVVAPVDASVSGSDGLLEASAQSGPVRVDLPRAVADVSLEVGGQLYLRVRDGALDVTVPATTRSDSEVSFRIPE